MKLKSKNYDAVEQFCLLIDDYQKSTVKRYRAEVLKNGGTRRTDGDDIEEKQARISDLTEAESSLASILSSCDHNTWQPCRSVACPVCANIFKAYMVNVMKLSTFKDSHVREMFMLTVFDPKRVVKAGDLTSFDITAFMRWFRKFVKPLLDSGAEGFAVVEFMYRTKEKVYVPHIHFVGKSLGEGAYKSFLKSEEVKKLKNKAKVLGMYRPMVLVLGTKSEDTIYHKTAMLSYLCKFTTSWKNNLHKRQKCTRPRKVLKNGVDGGAIHVEQLHFLHNAGIYKLVHPIGRRMSRLPWVSSKVLPD